MRRINMRYGLRQRLNDMWGTDEGVLDPSETGSSLPLDTQQTQSTIPGLTSWSIQAAMIENIRRVVKGFVGNAQTGRVGAGLRLEEVTSMTFKITNGIGFTKGGDIIVTSGDINSIDFSGKEASTPYYVYLRHLIGILDEEPTSPNGGKKTGFIRKPSDYISYDDYAASKGSSVNGIADEIVLVASSESTDDNLVFLGTITTDGSSHIDTIEQTVEGALPSINHQYVIHNLLASVLEVSGESAFGNDITISGKVIAEGFTSNPGLEDGINLSVQLKDQDGVDNHFLQFKNGILVTHIT